MHNSTVFNLERIPMNYEYVLLKLWEEERIRTRTGEGSDGSRTGKWMFQFVPFPIVTAFGRGREGQEGYTSNVPQSCSH